MIIALFPKDDHIDLSEKIVEFLLERKALVVVPEEFKTIFSLPSLSEVSSIDCLITMGGDGTILKTAHQFGDFNIPILGINLGHLGYMADIPISEIYLSLEKLLQKKFTIEKRIMIEGKTKTATCLAINDFVLHRAHNASLIKISIHIDGLYLNTFEADGLIVATPTGSTAYSLAAGGPILSPTIDALILTPICPHTISNRPIVITAEQILELEYLSPYPYIEVRADGFIHSSLKSKEKINIRKSSKTFQLILLEGHDTFSTWRTKLGWSGYLRLQKNY